MEQRREDHEALRSTVGGWCKGERGRSEEKGGACVWGGGDDRQPASSKHPGVSE